MQFASQIFFTCDDLLCKYEKSLITVTPSLFTILYDFFKSGLGFQFEVGWVESFCDVVLLQDTWSELVGKKIKGTSP